MTVDVAASALLPASATMSALKPETATGTKVWANRGCQPVNTVNSIRVKMCFMNGHYRLAINENMRRYRP